MAIGSLYQLTANWSNSLPGASQSKAQFYYAQVSDDAAPGAEEVADAFVTNVLTDIVVETFNPRWGCNSLITYQLDDLSNFNSTNPELTGNATGDPWPPFVVWEARSPWEGKGKRRAYKRFPAGNLSHTNTDGSSWSSTYQAVIREYADALGRNLVADGVTLQPVVVTKTCPGGGAPCTYAVASPAVGDWEVCTRILTQNSRKTDYNWVPVEIPE